MTRDCHAMLAGASMLAIFCGGTASAQTAATPSNEESASPATDEPAIVVTAQRRAENARDVPISLTVADAETLERAGVTNMLDLPLITPGLKVDRFGVSTQPTIRGITTRENSPGMDASVAIYVDGVYQPSQAANGFDLPDIVRIEVSKGPQGTLFGRNATGGAIQIFTADPSYDFGGSVSASYGRFDEKSLKGRINIPLADGLAAVSLTGFHQDSDGYSHDLLNGGSFGKINSDLIRGKLLIEPAPWLKFMLIGQYSHREDEGVGGGSPLNGNAVGRTIPGTIVPEKPYDVAVNDVFTDVKNKTISLKADADLGFAKLSSVTAYNDVDIHYLVEGDFTSANLSAFESPVYSKTFTQEVTLTSPAGHGGFNWVAGVFYYDNKGAYNPLNVKANGAVVLARYGQQQTKAYAAFAEGTLALTDRLTAIGGVRYSYEKHFLSGHTGSSPNMQLAEKAWDSITPRFSLRYEVAPRTNAYFTFSKGFKSGGFTTTGLAGIDPFNPEKVTAYEAGVKTDARGFRLNAAAFYIEYSDQQVLTILQQGNVQVQRTLNAARSKIYGFEADGQLTISDDLTANAALSLLHARYSDYRDALVQTPKLVGGVPCRCGNMAAVIDASGNQLIRAPDYTVSAGLTYRHAFPAGLVEASSNIYFSGKYVFTSDERIFQPAYENLTARIAFQPRGQPFRSLWGQNLTNSTVIEGTSILPNGDGVWYAKPRTYGVALDVDF